MELGVGISWEATEVAQAKMGTIETMEARRRCTAVSQRVGLLWSVVRQAPPLILPHCDLSSQATLQPLLRSLRPALRTLLWGVPLSLYVPHCLCTLLALPSEPLLKPQRVDWEGPEF